MERKPRHPGDTEAISRRTNGDGGKDGGWKIVNRRKDRSQPKTNNKGRTKPPKHASCTEFNRNKCFRCLSKQHRIAQCREPLRCHKCLRLGHYSYSCTIKPNKPPPRPTTHKPTLKTSEISYAQALKPTMNEEEFEPFLNVRPEEEEAFLPPHESLNPVNQYLNRAAWIRMQHGEYSRNFVAQVQTTLARIHGGRPDSYGIENIDENKLLLVCSGVQLRDDIVQQSPYVIPSLGLLVSLYTWKPTDDMHFHPPRYEAWVRLLGVPLFMRNSEGINRLAVKLGTVKVIQLYGLHARQLQHITIQIATKHPCHLPKFLTAKVGDYDRRVRVKLLAWRIEDPTDFLPPPPPPGGRQHTTEPQQQQPVQRFDSPNIHSYSGSSSASSNDHP